MRRHLLFAATVVTVLGMLALPARGTSPGRNGQIAFTRYRLQDDPIWSEIYVSQPDGSGERRVSHSEVAVEDDQAQWSPDGSWIVFDRCLDHGPCQLWLVRADGSGQRRLSQACPSKRPPPVCADDGSPSFAPDGRHVVFTHAWGRIRHSAGSDQIEHSAIAIVDLQGSHLTLLRQLARYAGDLQTPRISPNGRMIVFDRFNSPSAHPAGADALMISRLDGGPARQLTPWRLSAGSPDWSPDSKRILFKRFVQGAGELAPGTNLYTVRADGTGTRRITDVGSSHYALGGSFSPDGKSIVFATDDNATLNPRGGTPADIFTMRLGNTTPLAVTRTENLDGWPSWGAAD